MPPGSDAVVICNAGAPIVIDSARLAVAPCASRACTVNANAPAAVGVPAIPAPESASPGGNPPLTDHVYGGAPPVAENPAEYATPTVPPGSAPVVTANGAAIVMPKARRSLPSSSSRTRTVNENEPAAEGVPRMTPAGFSDNPGGSDPSEIDHRYGRSPPVAWRDAS